MKNSGFSWQMVPGTLLCSLGAMVLLGWISGTPSMVRIVPEGPAMSINTALMFVLSGLGMLLKGRNPDSRSVPRLIVPVLIILPILILLEHLFDIDLRIDLAQVHAALGDGHARPGRTAVNACLGFLFAGLVLFLDGRIAHTRASRAALRMLAGVVIAIGVSAMLGYLLRLEAMYKFASLNRMATLTAGGMLVLGIGLWTLLAQRALRDYLPTGNEGQRITRLAATLLTVFAIAGGLSGLVLLRQGFEKSVTDNTHNAASSNAFSISFALDNVTRLASSIDNDPILYQQLKRLNARPDDPDALAALDDVTKHFAALGFTGVSVSDGSGRRIAHSGVMASEQATMRVDFSSNGKPAVLYWQDGLLFKIERQVREGEHVIGRVVMENRLTTLTAFILELQHAGQSGDLLLCGKQGVEAVCFPSRFYRQGFRVPLLKPDGRPTLPAARSLLGENGAMIVKDLRGIQVLAGYAALPSQDLGLVLKTDIEELYVPLREKLNWLALFLLGFIVAGTLLLRKWVQPLIARIVSEQQRMNVILEHSHDAFIATDTHGKITDWNRQAEQTFGWTRAHAIGRGFIDLLLPGAQGTLVQSRFVRLQQADYLRSDSRLEVEALHCQGHAVPVEMSLAAFRDGGECGLSIFCATSVSTRQPSVRQLRMRNRWKPRAPRYCRRKNWKQWAS